MLQDLAFGKLDNAFREKQPGKDARILCFRDGEILVARAADDTLSLPSFSQAEHWSSSWEHWNDTFRYVFNLQDIDYFVWMGQAGECPDAAFQYEPVRSLRQLPSKEVCFAVMTGWHLYTWYRNNRFCGRCGQLTRHDHTERMLFCPACGNMIFPRISPAVIIAVTDGDRLLLSKYAGRAYTRYALLAGYTEIGETLEETVQREVMEEVGLRVKNIRYYKSQPWGVESNVLMGFFCDLDGSDAISLDTQELSMAKWFRRSEIPAKDDGISLTREMIRVFQEGKEGEMQDFPK